MTTTPTTNILSQRESTYGPAPDQFAAIQAANQSLLRVASPQGMGDPAFRHVLYMVLTKLARLAYCPTHVDSWQDIHGYVALYERTLPPSP